MFIDLIPIVPAESLNPVTKIILKNMSSGERSEMHASKEEIAFISNKLIEIENISIYENGTIIDLIEDGYIVNIIETDKLIDEVKCIINEEILKMNN